LSSFQLKPTPTHCWIVEKRLALLFDPKRRRKLYVLGEDPGDKMAIRRVAETLKAAKSISSVHFLDDAGTDTGYAELMTYIQSKDGPLSSFLHSSDTLSFYDKSDTTATYYPSQEHSRIQGSKLKLSKWLSSRPSRSTHRGFPVSRWSRFLRSYRAARSNGVWIGPQIVVIQNEEADAGNGPTGNNLIEFQLGPDRGDLTVRVFLGSVPKDDQDAEDVKYLQQMASLERAWDSSPTPGSSTSGLEGEGDWGDAQRAQSTTGRAKDSSPDYGDDEPKLLAKPIRSSDGEDQGDESSNQPPSSSSVLKSRSPSKGNAISISTSIVDEDKDMELATLLLGRTASNEEVQQLRAAFAQAIETEVLLSEEEPQPQPEASSSGVKASGPGFRASSARLRQALESFIQGSSSPQESTRSPSESSQDKVDLGSSGQLSEGPGGSLALLKHKKRLSLPSTLHKMNASRAFQAPSVQSSSPHDSDLVSALLRRLRVPPSHRYARGRDILVVVPSADVGPLVGSWDQMERRLMMTL
jgi:hypothetical protein